MRSFVLIFGTAAALFAAFLIYTRIAAPPHRDSAPDVVAAPVATTTQAGADSNSPYASGAWSNLYDKDGQLYGRLRSRVCVPQADGQWALTQPEAEFYEADGQIVHLTAKDGYVVLGQQTHRQDLLGGGPVDPPSQGTLRDVTVTLYPNAAAYDQQKPEMTIQMQNTHFDADTYRLYTVAQRDDSGQVTSADLIPVKMTGKEADFDGTGMLLDWNAQTHELKSLTIAHGKRLVLHNQSSAASGEPPSGASSSPKTKPSAAQVPADVHEYLALFNGGVRVVQNGADRVLSSQMLVTMTDGHDQTPRPAADAPADNTATAGGPAKQSSKKSQPVEVYWGGTLRVIPATTTVPLKPGESIVRFTGSSVKVLDTGMHLVGTDVVYDNASGVAVATGTTVQPLRITFLNPHGAVKGIVQAEQAQYLQDSQHILFNGAGKANFADPDKPDESMRVAWMKSCNIKLTGTGDSPQIEQADMIGDASVIDGPTDGPAKLHLTAGLIHTLFEPVAPAPHVESTRVHTGSHHASESDTPSSQLRDMVAIGNAHCLIHEENAADRSLAGDTLTVEMGKDSTGKPFPKFITSEGHVHAQQDKEDLSSDRLDATVAPAAQGADASQFQLQTMLATGNVLAHNAQGDTAAGDTLTVDQRDNQQWVTLIGSPFATVSGDNRTLKGPRIELKPNENWALATGPGEIVGLAAGRPGEKPLPLHAHWNGSATVMGPQNQIDIVGGVEADNVEANGTKNTALADHAILFLVARPGAPAQNNAPSQTAQFGMLKDKQVQTISLRQNASIESTLLAPDKSILRRAFIEGDQIDHDVPAQRLTVPGAGRMLIEEHTKSAAAAAANAGSPAGGQGITAFSWNKKFTFDQTKRQAVIDGSVQIRHQPDGKASKPTALAADHVTADFLPLAVNPETGDDQQLQLKHLSATGHVLVRDADKLIQAQEVDYDPVTEQLTAIGSEDNLVIVTDTKTGGEESFVQAQINTRTNQFSATDVSGHARR